MTLPAHPARMRTALASLILVLAAGCGGGGDDGDTGQLSPVITSQPADVNAVAGNSARLSVSASGSRPLDYQWSSSADGIVFAPVIGATDSTYDTGATTLAQTGTRYRVVVSNSIGSITSNAARLTVTMP